ncbi:MAG: substrate-binding domain-containing protein [Phycisphaerales bacterium JB040]
MTTDCDNSDTRDTQERSVLLAMSWYDHRVHRGISRYAQGRSWRVDARMANSTELAWGWQGDGVIAKLGCSTLDESLRDFILGLGCPTIDLSVFGPEQGLHSLEFDPDAIGTLAVDHFLERGFRRFAWYPDLDLPPIAIRRTGFEHAAAREGATVHALKPIAETGTKNNRAWAEAERALGEQLAALELPIAVMAFNDEWGAQIIRACERVGLRVPEQVAVLGVDDNELVCEHLSVPLSSVALDLERWGELAAQRLGELMDTHPTERAHKQPTMQLVQPRGVVARRSTDVLAVAHPDVAHAAKYIAEHFRENIGVEDVIAHGRMSGSGLKRAFRTHLRRSISEEIQRVRLEATRRLLTQTDWTLDRIADEVGLGSARSLHRLFARAETESPTEFRQRRNGERGTNT